MLTSVIEISNFPSRDIRPVGTIHHARAPLSPQQLTFCHPAPALPASKWSRYNVNPEEGMTSRHIEPWCLGFCGLPDTTTEASPQVQLGLQFHLFQRPLSSPKSKTVTCLVNLLLSSPGSLPSTLEPLSLRHTGEQSSVLRLQLLSETGDLCASSHFTKSW